MDVSDAVVAGFVAHIIGRADVGVNAQDDLAPESEAFEQFHPGRLCIVAAFDGFRLVRNPEQHDIGIGQCGRFPIDLLLPADPSLAVVRVQECDAVDSEALCELRYGALPFGRAFHRPGQKHVETGLFGKGSWGFDDGIYAALRCLEILSENKEVFNKLPYGFVTPEIRISCSEDKKFRIIEKTKEKLQSQGINFADIDGVRVSGEKGWWLIRASNTQNAISLRVEAEKEEHMKPLLNEVTPYLKPFIKDIEQTLKKYAEHE